MRTTPRGLRRKTVLHAPEETELFPRSIEITFGFFEELEGRGDAKQSRRKRPQRSDAEPPLGDLCIWSPLVTTA